MGKTKKNNIANEAQPLKKLKPCDITFDGAKRFIEPINKTANVAQWLSQSYPEYNVPPTPTLVKTIKAKSLLSKAEMQDIVRKKPSAFWGEFHGGFSDRLGQIKLIENLMHRGEGGLLCIYRSDIFQCQSFGFGPDEYTAHQRALQNLIKVC